MSAIALLLGLLVLSYVGSILVGDRTIRGFGLPSGIEYLLLGFLLGPHALGLVNRSLIATFEPMLVAGAAWLALVAGIGYGQVGRRSVEVGSALFGVLAAAVVGAGVGSSVYGVLAFGGGFGATERWLLACAAGAVSCETTRHAVRWVVERHGAKGKVSNVLADSARASVAVPAMALAFLFAAGPGQGLPQLALELRVATTLAVGAVLGLVASLLLGREFRRDESWGLLLGTSLLGIGIAVRLGLSAIAATFVMGLTVNVTSPHRADLKTMVAPTEKPVFLPLAVLTGAFVHIEPGGFVPILVATVLGARIVMDLARGTLLVSCFRSARPAGPLVGLGMISAGAFTIACALTVGLRFPGRIGDSVVALAVAGAVLGELLGPLMLRRALVRAGNIVPGETQTPPPPSVDPTRSGLGSAR